MNATQKIINCYYHSIFKFELIIDVLKIICYYYDINDGEYLIFNNNLHINCKGFVTCNSNTIYKNNAVYNGLCIEHIIGSNIILNGNYQWKLQLNIGYSSIDIGIIDYPNLTKYKQIQGPDNNWPPHLCFENEYILTVTINCNCKYISFKGNSGYYHNDDTISFSHLNMKKYQLFITLYKPSNKLKLLSSKYI